MKNNGDNDSHKQPPEIKKPFTERANFQYLLHDDFGPNISVCKHKSSAYHRISTGPFKVYVLIWYKSEMDFFLLLMSPW